ncbi:putative porin, partial [Acinetobacter baumannii]|uniref:putative porin n=1 Tax=Acinetobacter baumannii TaxID=470 RepID=UPI0004F53553
SSLENNYYDIISMSYLFLSCTETNFEGQTYIGDETTYRLGADLYLDPTLSIGASFADSTAEDSDTIFSLRAQKFFTPQVAVGLTYTTVDDANSFGINGAFRF